MADQIVVNTEPLIGLREVGEVWVPQGWGAADN